MSLGSRGGVQVTNLTWTPFASSKALLQNISFSVEPGERVLLIGPSGSGKSTLLRAIAGVLSETEAGELNGEIVADEAGLLLQDPNDTLVSDSIYREVAFGLENAGFERLGMKAIAREQLDQVGLNQPLERPSGDLSGGEMQRMAFAGVMAMQPKLLLLDEPTSMLDQESAASVRASVSAQVERLHSTLIVVEHQFEEWLPLVNRLLVLNGSGELVFDGEPGDILSMHGQALIELGLWVPGIDVPRPLKYGLGEGVGGRITVLVGKSGAGKTTELKRRLQNDPLGKTIQTGVGYVPQNAEMTIIGNDVFGSASLTAQLAASGLGITQSEAAEHTHRLLDSLGVGSLVDKNPYEISGGEQRRVALATALAHWPMAVYLDEPTIGQDRDSWAAIVGAILSARDSGIKITLATHDPFLISLADEVIEIRPELGPPVELHRPKVSGLVVLLAPILLLLGSTSVTTLHGAIASVIVAAVAAAILGAAGLRIKRLKLLIPGLIGVASIGFSNWYLSDGLMVESGLIAAMRVSLFVLPGILLATQLKAIPLGDHLGQTLRLPARPVVAAMVGMQRTDTLLSTWGELRFIHKIRGMGIGRTPLSRFREFSRLVFALLVQSIRGAGTTAVAMDARGFSKSSKTQDGKRSWAESPSYGGLDLLTLGLAVVVAATPLAAHLLGL